MKPTIRNFNQVQARVKLWQQRARRQAELTARGLSVELLRTLIQSSPQWTGDFASNWRFSIGSPDYSFDTGDVAFRAGPEVSEPWQQGSRPAVELGLAKNRGKELNFQLGQTIYISNSSTHDTTYAGPLFDGKVKLRDVNRVMTMQDALMDFSLRYGRVLSKSASKQLSRKLI